MSDVVPVVRYRADTVQRVHDVMQHIVHNVLSFYDTKTAQLNPNSCPVRDPLILLGLRHRRFWTTHVAHLNIDTYPDRVRK